MSLMDICLPDENQLYSSTKDFRITNKNYNHAKLNFGRNIALRAWVNIKIHF